jgi:hypothetical protein
MGSAEQPTPAFRIQQGARGKLMNAKRNAIAYLIVLCIVPAAVHAEGNIHVGQLKINPYVSVNEAVSDNIFYTSTDQRNDSLTTTTPGIRLQYPFRMHQANIEYHSVLTRYHTYKSEDTTDYFTNGNVNLKFGSLLSLNLSDAHVKGHEPRSSSSTGAIELFRTNAAAASATYQLADLSKIQLDYTKSLWHFQTSAFRNRDEDLVSAYFYYRVLPKTSAFLEYDRKHVMFSDKSLNLDNDADSLQAGLTWEITARSKGTVKAGTITKDFTSSTKGDFKGWTGYADIRHDFTDNTSGMLNGQRTVNETALLGNRYFITTGAYAELSHKFGRKLSGVVRGSYGQDRYADLIGLDATVRTDRTQLEGAGLKYAMKDWLEFALDYNSRERRSNIPVNDYRENSAFLTVSVSL